MIAGPSSDSDAAVGAFMNLIQGAPPLERSIMFDHQESGGQPSQASIVERSCALQSSQEMTLQDGLDQLAKYALQLNQ